MVGGLRRLAKVNQMLLVVEKLHIFLVTHKCDLDTRNSTKINAQIPYNRSRGLDKPID
jgi:hypothetical protein